MEIEAANQALPPRPGAAVVMLAPHTQSAVLVELSRLAI